MLVDLIKVFVPAVLAFTIGICLTPLLTHYLYAHRMWKKQAGKGSGTPLFNRLHETREVGVPRFGGIIIWSSAAVATLGVFAAAQFFTSSSLLEKLDFLSRDQTWLPLTALLIGAFIGFIDDWLEINGDRGGSGGGLALRTRLLIVALVGLLAGWWFYGKLAVVAVGIPFSGPLFIGAAVIPLFAVVTLAVYSGGIIDGIDGLAGGVFAIIFATYGAIAFFQNQLNLAAFCAALTGGILAFLWFNIPPARFYMSETGSMALTLTLAVVAFMTDSLGEGTGLLVLPLVAFPLVITSASVIVQQLSRRLFNRRILCISPLHHHFEAIGWPPYKVTMRYWVFGVVTAIVGVIVALIG